MLNPVLETSGVLVDIDPTFEKHLNKSCVVFHSIQVYIDDINGCYGAACYLKAIPVFWVLCVQCSTDSGTIARTAC